jgi:hypothetical protein
MVWLTALPDDVVLLVGDFLVCPAFLATTCLRLHAVLRQHTRNVTLGRPEVTGAARRLVVRVLSGDVVGTLCPLLAGAVQLRHLVVQAAGAGLDGRLFTVLSASLASCVSLESVGVLAGCNAVADWNEIHGFLRGLPPTVETVRLNLEGNPCALPNTTELGGGLAHLPNLHTLHLGLGGMHSRGTAFSVAHCCPRQVSRFSVVLGNSPVADGPVPVGRLLCSTMRNVCVVLSHTLLLDDGCVGNLSRLRRLRLELGDDRRGPWVDDNGAAVHRTLGALAAAVSLEVLDLGLSGINLQRWHADLAALVSLLTVPNLPALSCLGLGLARTRLGTHEARTLAETLSLRSTALCSLSLDVRGNDMGLVGDIPATSPWVPLRYLSRLRSLTIDLGDNHNVRSSHVNGTLFLTGALPELRDFRLSMPGNRTVEQVDLAPLAYAQTLTRLLLDFSGVPLRQHRLSALSALTQLRAVEHVTLLPGG